MDAPEPTKLQPSEGEPAADQAVQLLGLVTAATQKLLGDTIRVSDDDWRAPSRLPNWSRGHVATHIARQADGLVRLTEWARTGERRDMYASSDQRAAEIEAGAGRSGLDLQIDLDTSAGALGQAFEVLATEGAWAAVVELRGGMRAPARLLPLARLSEVVLHHVDLDIGFDIDEVDQETADWIIEWFSYRVRGRDDVPPLQVRADSGLAVTVGRAGEPRPVTGTSTGLLGWLTGRAAPDAVTGADGLVLPPL